MHHTLIDRLKTCNLMSGLGLAEVHAAARTIGETVRQRDTLAAEYTSLEGTIDRNQAAVARRVWLRCRLTELNAQIALWENECGFTFEAALRS